MRRKSRRRAGYVTGRSLKAQVRTPYVRPGLSSNVTYYSCRDGTAPLSADPWVSFVDFPNPLLQVVLHSKIIPPSADWGPTAPHTLMASPATSFGYDLSRRPRNVHRGAPLSYHFAHWFSERGNTNVLGTKNQYYSSSSTFPASVPLRNVYPTYPRATAPRRPTSSEYSQYGHRERAHRRRACYCDLTLQVLHSAWHSHISRDV